MKRALLSAAILSASLFAITANAQVSAKKGITQEEILKELNSLSEKGEAGKADLIKEAEFLAKSNDESLVSLAARVYDNLGNKAKVEEINKLIEKKFPKGLKPRNAAYSKLFEKEDITAAEAEKNYNEWAKNFPESSFPEKNRELYAQGLSTLATLYAKEGNVVKVNIIVDKIKGSSDFAWYLSKVSTEFFKADNYKAALPLLEGAYAKALADSKSEDEVKKGEGVRALNSLTPSYAKALFETGNSAKSLELLEELVERVPYYKTNENVSILLADSYSKVGRDLDAFNVLNKFTIDKGKSEKVAAKLESLFNKLNNDKSNFTEYYAALDEVIKAALVTKYKNQMIKKEAPAFSLVNQKGETVSLADLKGKVVILDFWATWCGPCKISFPGMQAAVDKYKDDKEVEFLFVNTWQREDDYQEVVNKFIEDNKYRFHVVFDEMKDRSKATVSAYGVRGIPTKVVIDKEGFVRFQAAGGSDNVQEIVSEMETKIELAKKG